MSLLFTSVLLLFPTIVAGAAAGTPVPSTAPIATSPVGVMLDISPHRAVLNVPGLSVWTNASGRNAPYTYLFNGLPPGCASAQSAFQCTPTELGWFHVNVTITDSKGGLGHAGPISIQVVPGLTPPSRAGSGLAYDYADHYLVMFGGDGASDTWVYQGGTWRQVGVGGTAPSARDLIDGQMVWDPFDNYVLLWSGRSGGTETWSFRGGNWNEICTSCAPALEESTTIADPVDGVMLTVAGQQNNGFADTNSVFSYRAGTWTQLPKTPFASRQSQAGAWDATAGHAVVYGGYNYSGSACFGSTDLDCRDTWDYVGGTWTELCTGGMAPPSCVPTPPARHAPMSAWDPWLDGFVVFGGQNQSTSTTLSDTWLWKAGAWTDLTSSAGPRPPAQSLPMVYDANSRDHAVLSFGGTGASTQTWMLRNGTWSMPYIVSGSVTNASTGAPIAGANVTDGSDWATTDSTGAYNLTEKNGSFTLHASDPAYFTGTAGITVAGRGLTQDFALTAALRAWAGASPTSGSVPLAVSFSSGATGGSPGYAYLWHFGDGGSSSVASPSYTFVTAGSYVTRLWVNDTAGNSVSTTIPITVSATGPLSATANGTPSEGTVPLQVGLTASASGGTGIYSYAWRFGDGSVSAYRAPTHVYNASGAYAAELWVNDSGGHSANVFASVTVLPPLVAAAIANVTSGFAPLPVGFNGSAGGGLAPYSFLWRFGDGVSSLTRNANHTYSTAGNFVARLWVNDSLTDSSTSTVAVSVSPYPPVSVTTSVLPAYILIGGWVNFTVGVSGGTGVYPTVAFSGLPSGCVSQSTLSLPCRPTLAGHFNTTATVADSLGHEGTGTVAWSVVALPPLSVSLSSSSLYFPLGGSAWLNASVSGGSGTYVLYGWTGLPAGCAGADAATLRCLPSSVGHYNATVTVTDSRGTSASSTAAFSVYAVPVPLLVHLTPSAPSVALGGTVTLTATPSGGSGTYPTYSWSLPPGCPSSNQAAIACTPSATGTFQVQVVVQDSLGHTARASTNVTVVPPAPAPPTLGSELGESSLWVALLLVAVVIGVLVIWLLVGRRSQQPRGAVPPRKPTSRPRVPPRTPAPPPSSATLPTAAPTWAPLPPPPPDYYSGVAWSTPRAEWDEEPEQAYGSYTVQPAPVGTPTGTAARVPPKLGTRPWVMNVTHEGIQVEELGSAKISQSPRSATSRSTSEREEADITARSEDEAEEEAATVASPPRVTPDHAYAVLQALDRKPRSLAALRQVIRLEDDWLLGLVSALVHARMVASGQSSVSQQTVFALTPAGRKLARRSFFEGGGDGTGLGEPKRAGERGASVPSPPAAKPAPPLDLEKGSTVSEVRRIGEERGTLEEESPFEGLRPEDVNPQLKGQKPLPKKVLQPMEMRVTKDRGTGPADRSENSDSEERARRIMLAAKKARAAKAAAKDAGTTKDAPSERRG